VSFKKLKKKRTTLNSKHQTWLINVFLLAMMKGKKGGKCMDPDTHKICVSQDVVFD
jgi:hypothetical protein